MIDVRVVTPFRRKQRNGQYQTVRSAALEEKMRPSGSPLQRMLFRHQYECVKTFLSTLNDIECNAKATCAIDKGEFSADGFVEVQNPQQKKALEEAIAQLMLIGRNAKHCRDSSFVLEINQTVKSRTA